MNLEDCYPRLAVWARGYATVRPATVTSVPLPPSELGVFVVADEERLTHGESARSLHYRPGELSPRDPNNLDEVPPEPLDPLGLSNFGAW